MKPSVLSVGTLVLAGWALVAPEATGQAAGEAFTATASVKAESGSAKTAPVRISVERFATETERASVVDALKSGGTPAVKTVLSKMNAMGTLEVGGHKTPIKYAYTRPTGSGRLVTVVTAEPVVHLGAGLPDAKPRAGYDLAVVLLVLDAGGAGDGEFAPAAQLKVNESGALVIADYGADKVWLKGVAKAK